MASIYWRGKPGQKKWAWARARHKGREIREPLGTTSPREAAELFKTWLANLEAIRKPGNGSQATFDDAVDLFMEHHLNTLKVSSQKRYILSLMTMRPFFEGKLLSEITRSVLAEFVSHRRKTSHRKGKTGVAAGTIRRDLACLSSVFTIADDFEKCDVNPVTSFMRNQKKHKLVEAPPRTRYLSHEEEDIILREAFRQFQLVDGKGSGKRALSKRMILAAITAAIDTGLRDEELLGLKWEQVDFERGEITVLADNAKNGKQRQVPMLDRVRNILVDLPRNKHSTLVFWHRNGVRFFDLNHTLQAIARKVGVTGIRWHDLRRTCGCRLLQDYEFKMERVSSWLGHSSVVQTEKTYAFLNVRHLHEALANSRTSAGTKALPRPTNTGIIDQ